MNTYVSLVIKVMNNRKEIVLECYAFKLEVVNVVYCYTEVSIFGFLEYIINYVLSKLRPDSLKKKSRFLKMHRKKESDE